MHNAALQVVNGRPAHIADQPRTSPCDYFFRGRGNSCSAIRFTGIRRATP